MRTQFDHLRDSASPQPQAIHVEPCAARITPPARPDVRGTYQDVLERQTPPSLTLRAPGSLRMVTVAGLPGLTVPGLGCGAVGEVCGRLTFDLTGETPLINNGLVWRHLPKVRATFMTTPFAVLLQAEGSLYRAPTSVLPVLELPQGSEMFALLIEGPITGGTLERWVRLAPRNQFLIDPATAEKVEIRLSPTVGTLSGSFINVATKQRQTLQGVVVQGHQMMGGFFRGATEPGEFLITPRLQ